MKLDAPAYRLNEAAELLGVPTKTVRLWTREREGLPPAISTAGPNMLSFTNLVEVHVLAGLRRLRLSAWKVAESARGQLGGPHPFADERFEAIAAIFPELAAYVRRIDYKDGRAVRLFPLWRDDAPRWIVIDPRRAFGRPTVAGTSVTVEAIRSRFVAGSSIATIAEELGIRFYIVEGALRMAVRKRFRI